MYIVQALCSTKWITKIDIDTSLRFGSAAQSGLSLFSMQPKEARRRSKWKGKGQYKETASEGAEVDAGQIIHLPHPFSAFQTIQPSCGNPSPRTPHRNSCLWGHGGTPDGLDEISCIVQSNPSPLRASLFHHPSHSSLFERRGAYSFQFARAVHSTADRKILEEEIFFPFLFSSPFASARPNPLRSFPRLYSTFPSAPTNAWRFSVAEHTSESRLNELFINTMLLMRWAISPDS